MTPEHAAICVFVTVILHMGWLHAEMCRLEGHLMPDSREPGSKGDLQGRHGCKADFVLSAVFGRAVGGWQGRAVQLRRPAGSLGARRAAGHIAMRCRCCLLLPARPECPDETGTIKWIVMTIQKRCRCCSFLTSCSH